MPKPHEFTFATATQLDSFATIVRVKLKRLGKAIRAQRDKTERSSQLRRSSRYK
ncbi:MAG: hypothetical protein ACI87E_002917, partial [Mariniblastus sp.]